MCMEVGSEGNNKIFLEQINILQEQDERQQKWEIYQPMDQNLTLFKAFGKEIKNLLIFTIVLSTIYLVITLLAPFTIVTILVLFVASFMLIRIHLTQIKKQGLINKLSPKLKQLLLQKSIFDIYSDLLYFPLITKIIGAFIKPLLLKPHPQQLHQTFQSLPNNIQLGIARKGILNLAPKNVQSLFVSPQTIQPLPQNFGVETWQWKNYELYQNHHQKVHQQTIVKKIVEKIDRKVSWTGFMGMAGIVTVGVYKNPSKLKKILLHNGLFVVMIFLFFVIAIKLQKRANNKRKQQQQRRIGSVQINLLEKDG